MLADTEAILRRIEAAGCRVRGYHDTIDGSRGLVTVTATSGSETFTAQDSSGDETAALNQLAHRLGLDSYRLEHSKKARQRSADPSS